MVDRVQVSTHSCLILILISFPNLIIRVVLIGNGFSWIMEYGNNVVIIFQYLLSLLSKRKEHR